MGALIYGLAKDLFPINRSITGDGVRKTLARLKDVFPGIVIHEIPSGTKVFDWTIPLEWNVRDAYIECPDGRRIAEFKKNNLHLVGYSTPIDRTMPLPELQEYLHSLPGQPSSIPYVTSYYKSRFGFCLAHEERENLPDGSYRVYIDSELKNGSRPTGR
jgi:aminopeptidase-like protein